MFGSHGLVIPNNHGGGGLMTWPDLSSGPHGMILKCLYVFLNIKRPNIW